MIDPTVPWPLIAIGVVLALVLLWWVIAASRKTRVTIDRRDTLDEGAAPAARNQALIDAAPAAEAGSPLPVSAPEAVGGAGVAVEAGALQAARQAADGDDLTRIKGLGPKIAALLAEHGITRFAQIAAWDEAEINRVDALLGRFQGRIRRDGWVEQAAYLDRGDIAGFESRFGAG